MFLVLFLQCPVCTDVQACSLSDRAYYSALLDSKPDLLQVRVPGIESPARQGMRKARRWYNHLAYQCRQEVNVGLLSCSQNRLTGTESS